MGPISKRLQNLEKERAIWHCYLEWIEDYCTVYYGLLNYLNATSTDLDKLCRNKSFHAKNLSESSELINPSDRELVREEDSQYEGEVSSEVEWDKMTCSTDFKLFTAFAKTLSNMQVSTFDKGYINDDVKYVDSNSGMSWGFTSTVEEPDTGKGTTEEERSSEVKRLKRFQCVFLTLIY